MGDCFSTQPSLPPPPPLPMHNPEPKDEIPYLGPQVQYRIMMIDVHFKNNMTFSFDPNKIVASSDVDAVYGPLASNYGEGFSLRTFYRIPGAVKQSGFTSVTSPYQGIFTRYPSEPTHEQWQLLIEKSMMQVQNYTSYRMIGVRGQASQGSVDHLMDLIGTRTMVGGRLICLEMNGQATRGVNQYGQHHGVGVGHHGVGVGHHGIGMGGFMSSGGFGVDMFFNMPLHPNPTIYNYQAVSIPIPYRSHQSGFTNVEITLDCDWNGTLAHYLGTGWRLVEIFYDKSQSATMMTGFTSSQATVNSIWFFEKDSARLYDPTPLYQGTIIEFYLDIHQGFSGTSANPNWVSLMESMGQKGWELACILETPKIQRQGFTSMQQLCLLFFQRRIIYASGPPPVAAPQAPAGVAPPGPPGYPGVDTPGNPGYPGPAGVAPPGNPGYPGSPTGFGSVGPDVGGKSAEGEDQFAKSGVVGNADDPSDTKM